MSIYGYSTTAGDNTTVGGSSIAEGAPAGLVNNAIRGFVAEITEWRLDTGGALTSGGSANAQTLTTNGSIAALADGLLVAFKAVATNTTTTATLNVDALGAKKMRRLGDAELLAGDIVAGNFYLVMYSAAADTAAGGWVVLNPTKAPNDTNLVHIAGTETITGEKTFGTIITNAAAGAVAGESLRFAAAAGIGRIQVWNGAAYAEAIQLRSGAKILDLQSADLLWDGGKVWTASNDGAASGLDADLLDGAERAAFPELAGTQTFTAPNRFNGNVLFNTAGSAPALNNEANAAAWAPASGKLEISADAGLALMLNRKTSEGTLAQFRQAGVVVGTISVTASATSYNTSSDKRLKTHVARLAGTVALDRLANIPVNVFDWKATGERDVGLYAQEVVANDTAIARLAISRGSPENVLPSDPGFIAHGIDYSKFVPLLIAANQGLRERVIALEARVTALEAT